MTKSAVREFNGMTAFAAAMADMSAEIPAAGITAAGLVGAEKYRWNSASGRLPLWIDVTGDPGILSP